MKTYPILYAFREVVHGKDFVAAIHLHGSALATEEAPGEWCAYGVRPGAITAAGATLPEAFDDLRKHFRAYLLDCAKDATSFGAFSWELHRFFEQEEPETDAEWDAAVQAIRAGTAPPAGLTKQSLEENPRRIVVKKLSRPAPTNDRPPAEGRGTVHADRGEFNVAA